MGAGGELVGFRPDMELAAVCSCGWGTPRVPLLALVAEIQRHVDRSHSDSPGYGLSLIVQPYPPAAKLPAPR